ncbi:prosaposin isoform X1 [Carica papaya]|uniref:prosaposin isoform X1 n=1 Tax=Carica papaya TaxID=3649 RepID=UPI000B8C7D21|nr:prosaposin isoform X1 [Carica papaya]XP_021893847.1 prosaposin isoform X1 [Carica papaya]
MGLRVGLLFIFLLCSTWVCNARQLGAPELSVLKVNLKKVKDIQALESIAQNENVCTLCKEYTTLAVDYLEANKTQDEIIDALQKACSRMPTFKDKCITLVNYYSSIFFLEISSIQPEEFCRKVNLCEKVVFLASEFHEDSCGMCHRAVSEVLIKLKDPDTQLEIIELLLKGCKSMQNYATKCKKMVFEYGPLILVNAEQFLEKTDVCTMLGACKPGTEKASEVVNVNLSADS